jgi:hypothetical protein
MGWSCSMPEGVWSANTLLVGEQYKKSVYGITTDLSSEFAQLRYAYIASSRFQQPVYAVDGVLPSSVDLEKSVETDMGMFQITVHPLQ